ncbi:hypothetical protein BH11MYX2_BH11MYX2_41450 [soil metagenome]
MNIKEIVVYACNTLLVLGSFALVWQGVIAWEVALAFVGVLLVPSAGHVAVQRILTMKGRGE